ncbi:hypothetical protein JCM8208_004288 [Rhodotorula glutinis]
MVASFASLPLELVSRIVDMVHDDDQAWPTLTLFSTALKKLNGFDHLRDHTPSLHRDDWPAPWGRGIEALVQVDRRTRAAAVPHLYERLRARTTNSAHFRFRVLGQPLGLHVRHLDCGLATQNYNSVSLACALQMLPNLTSLVVDAKVLGARCDPLAGEGPEMLADGLENALGRITSLEIQSGSDTAVKYALSHVNKQRLRRLAIKPAASLVTYKGGPVADFNSFEALVEVELGVSRPEDRVRLQQHLRLQHVRSLSVMCAARQMYAKYEDALVLAHHIAPEVTTLTILAAYEVNGGQLPSSSPSPLLPTLRNLRLELDAPISLDCLHLPDLHAVEHLHITHMIIDAVHPLGGLAPTRPTALRTVTSAYDELYPVSLAPEDQAEWDRLGIRVVDEWRPARCDWQRIEADADDPDRDELEDAEEGVEGLARLFSWATERARWLLRVGDAHGLDELAGMVGRLRERYAVERS